MNKPTLAVYGDSYADDRNYYLCEHQNCMRSKWDTQPHIGPSYIEMLETDMSIQRYGKSGTSLYYSLKLFEKTHHYFDKILFIVTEPGRFEINQYQYRISDNFRHIYGLNTINLIKRKEKNLSLRDVEFLNILEEFYFIHMYKNPQQYFENEILKASIIKLRPDALVIDAFGNDDLTNLMSVQNLELKHWNISVNDLTGVFFNDMRKCHLTYENHIVFYNAVKDYFFNNTKFQIEDLPWACPSLPASHYIGVFK